MSILSELLEYQTLNIDTNERLTMTVSEFVQFSFMFCCHQSLIWISLSHSLWSVWTNPEGMYTLRKSESEVVLLTKSIPNNIDFRKTYEELPSKMKQPTSWHPVSRIKWRHDVILRWGIMTVTIFIKRITESLKFSIREDNPSVWRSNEPC